MIPLYRIVFTPLITNIIVMSIKYTECAICFKRFQYLFVMFSRYGIYNYIQYCSRLKNNAFTVIRFQSSDWKVVQISNLKDVSVYVLFRCVAMLKGFVLFRYLLATTAIKIDLLPPDGVTI